MPTQLPLVFDVPARGKAPRHWLDLSISERLAAMEAFGLPKFRADQISRHVFDGLSDDVTAWTDLPAAIRDDLKQQLFPPAHAGPAADRRPGPHHQNAVAAS